MHTKYRHILVMDVSQPKEYSLKVGNSRSNIVHCGRLVKCNMLEICQLFLLGKKKLVSAIEKRTRCTLIQQIMTYHKVLVHTYAVLEETLSITQDI